MKIIKRYQTVPFIFKNFRKILLNSEKKIIFASANQEDDLQKSTISAGGEIGIHATLRG